jgi:histidinol-phosphate aminotransferase
MLPFVRSDLTQLIAYTPHPGGDAGSSASAVDRLDTNENPYDLPDALKQKLLWHYQQIESNRYPDGAHMALKAAIAEYVNESAGLSARITVADQITAGQITADQISVGNGSDELIRSLLIASCVGGAGSILVARPTFSMYGILAQTLGIPVITVDRSASFETDLAAAQRAILQTATPQIPPIRAVFMVHPNSPTANPLTAAELDWLRGLPETILVVIDEAYFEFSQLTVVAELAQRPNWVVLRTFSKAFRLAAHRVGYAIASPELTAVLEKLRLPYNLPVTTQAAAQLALAHRQELLAVVSTLLTEREMLLRQLTTYTALNVYPSVANFIFVQLKDEICQSWQRSPEAALDGIFQELKTQGTLVRKINGGLRITVGTPEENQRTLARLQKAL